MLLHESRRSIQFGGSNIVFCQIWRSAALSGYSIDESADGQRNTAHNIAQRRADEEQRRYFAPLKPALSVTTVNSIFRNSSDRPGQWKTPRLSARRDRPTTRPNSACACRALTQGARSSEASSDEMLRAQFLLFAQPAKGSNRHPRKGRFGAKARRKSIAVGWLIQSRADGVKPPPGGHCPGIRRWPCGRSAKGAIRGRDGPARLPACVRAAEMVPSMPGPRPRRTALSPREPPPLAMCKRLC